MFMLKNESFWTSELALCKTYGDVLSFRKKLHEWLYEDRQPIYEDRYPIYNHFADITDSMIDTLRRDNGDDPLTFRWDQYVNKPCCKGETISEKQKEIAKVEMQIGDVVIPNNDNTVLSCGTGRYPCAIVAETAPFVLVSVDGDMLWKDEHATDYKSLCPAHDVVVARALSRWSSEPRGNP